MMQDNRRRQAAGVLLLSAAACLLMIFIESQLQPAYLVKSVCKVVIFAGVMLLCVKGLKVAIPADRVQKKSLILCVMAALVIYLFLLGGYFLASQFIDPAQIKESLLSKEHITRSNFLAVAAYITVFNSFIEELFFRGMLFLGVYRLGFPKLAYAASAGLFAVYHIGIVSSWFSWYMYVLIIAGLFAAGVILNRFAKIGDNIAYSWVIHIAANLGINTIGFMIL